MKKRKTIKRSVSLLLAVCLCCLAATGCGGSAAPSGGEAGGPRASAGAGPQESGSGKAPVATFKNEKGIRLDGFQALLGEILAEMGAEGEPQNLQIGSSDGSTGGYVDVQIGFDLGGRPLLAKGEIRNAASSDPEYRIATVEENGGEGRCYWANGIYDGDLYRFETGGLDESPRIRDPKIRAVLDYYHFNHGTLTAGVEKSSKETSLKINLDFKLSDFESPEALAKEYIAFAEYFCKKCEENFPYNSVYMSYFQNDAQLMLNLSVKDGSFLSTMMAYSEEKAYAKQLNYAYLRSPYFQERDIGAEFFQKDELKELESEGIGGSAAVTEQQTIENLRAVMLEGTTVELVEMDGKSTYLFTVPLSNTYEISDLQVALGQIATLLQSFIDHGDVVKNYEVKNFAARICLENQEVVITLGADCSVDAPKTKTLYYNPKYEDDVYQALGHSS